MSGYIGTQPVPQATQTRQTFVATAAQTSFATGGYSVSYLDVFLNGVKLQDGVDYTATNGSDIVLTVGAALDDTLEVVAYTAFEVADAATAAQGALADTAVQPNDSPTFTDLTLSGGVYLGGTGAANKLDDYESGTWTPSIRSTGTQPTFTYTTQEGWYHKIGNLVTISFNIVISTKTVAGSGTALVAGNPFTYGAGSGNPAGAMILSGVDLTAGCMGVVLRKRTSSSGTEFFPLQQLDNASSLTLQIGSFNAGDSWSGSISFEI